MKEIEHLLDTLIHKKYILTVGEKIIRKLLEEGEEETAVELSKRLIIHDDSKISSKEIKSLTKFNSLTSMANPDTIINDDFINKVKPHWEANRHHPEHFDDYHKMNDIDIWEMCCDWYSRSLQNGTDFIPFVIKRQNNRFFFDEDFFEIVYERCLKIEKWFKQEE